MLEIGQKVTKMDQDCLPANAEEIQEGPAQIDGKNASDEAPIEPAESKKRRVERGWMNLHLPMLWMKTFVIPSTKLSMVTTLDSPIKVDGS